MGHWYATRKTQEVLPGVGPGSPVYETRNAKGETVDIDLRHARKLYLGPSVSAILAVPDKPGLRIWYAGEIVKAARNVVRFDGEGDESHGERVLVEANRIGKEARDSGHAVHDALEAHFCGRMTDPIWEKYSEIIKSVDDVVQEFFGGLDFESEVPFISWSGYGGRIDLISRKPGKPRAVLDFKTKDKLTPVMARELASGKGRIAYPENAMQLAAYADGVFGSTDGVTLANLYVSTSHYGTTYLHSHTHDPEDRHGVPRALSKFKSLYNYWCLENDYFPGAYMEAA